MKAPIRLLLVLTAALGAVRAQASPTVRLTASPYQNPGPGDDVVVAATVDQVNGVTAMDLAFTYDPALMSPAGVFRTALTRGCAMTSSFATPGVVAIHFSKPTPLTGSGDLAWVTFHLAQGNPPNGPTPLTWLGAAFNGDALVATKVGTSLTVGTAVTTIAAPRTAYGVPSAQVQVPISVTSLSGGSAFDLILTYDAGVLAPVRVQKSSMTACMSINSNLAVSGTIRISMYGVCTVSGTGPLVQVTFNVIGTNGNRTPLNVTRGTIDEDRVPTVLADGLFNVCGAPDLDGDGYSVCAGDCNDGNAALNPGALESCNSLDDNCDGIVDNVVTPKGIPMIGMTPENGDTRLSWAPVPTASTYDLIRGSLSALAIDEGDFTLATDSCLASQTSAATYLEDRIPAEGDGYWYLVRPRNCGGPGTFDDFAYGLTLTRDSGINAAPASCP